MARRTIVGIGIAAIVGGSLGIPAIAHTVKTDADVGATFHIEPNHNPRAGETARAWFALTRKGGTLIPLEKCNCQLWVYSKLTKGTSPVLQPPLQAIDAEQYRDVPGAEIVFPEPGLYELELRGTPKETGAFQPFEFTYTVTVSPGTPVKLEDEGKIVPTASPSPQKAFEFPGAAIAGGLGLLLLLVGWRFLARRSKFDD
ncbi:MAG: hypothetical protein SW833_01855 [Cyanobacteriota bacterium]|nr:hypothetical protein [Cyanobacteriota bacterium]